MGTEEGGGVERSKDWKRGEENQRNYKAYTNV